MKILMVSQHPKPSGVDYHRLVLPHGTIGQNNPEVEISNINEIDSATDEFLQGFDLIVANRFISKMGDDTNLIFKLKTLGVPYVLDLDDDYRIPDWHVLYQTSRQGRHAARISECINGAMAVTVTHKLLQKTLLYETNQKNIFIVPNGIMPEKQFEPKPCVFKDKVNFGWSGSITHFEDVQDIHDGLYSLYSDESLDKEFRIVYGGFEPKDQTSQAIAGVLSAKGKAKEYQFATFPATDPYNYANFYDYINVSLIPLRANRFNSLKSNLKLLEAGFKKKAVIVSDVHPYSEDTVNGWNALTVKHKNDWYKHMTKLIREPQRIEELSLRLHEYVQQYHMNKVAEARYNIYKHIL